MPDVTGSLHTLVAAMEILTRSSPTRSVLLSETCFGLPVTLTHGGHPLNEDHHVVTS